MNFKAIILAVFFSMFLLACSPSKGSEFVGQWENINKSDDKMEFIKNGDSFLVIFNGDMKSPVSLEKDGTLKLSGFGTAIYAYSKNSDTVIGLGQEYKRIVKN